MVIFSKYIYFSTSIKVYFAEDSIDYLDIDTYAMKLDSYPTTSAIHLF